MKKIEPSIQTLKLFNMVAQTGQLTKAARKLKMSQSGASHALNALESNLGVTLFARDREGLTLSEVGRRLLPHVHGLLANLEAIWEEASTLSTVQAGVLRIAAVPSLAATILPPLIKSYSLRFPGIEVSLFEGTDDEVREWLLSGVVHAGFAALPVPDLEEEEIAQDEWIALVPEKKYINKTEISLRTLASQKFLMSGGGCEPHIQRLFLQARVEIPYSTMVKQLPTIEAMVAEDLGVSLVPSLSIRKPMKGIRALQLAPRRFRKIGLLRAKNAPLTPALEAWIELIRKHEKKLLPQKRKAQ